MKVFKFGGASVKNAVAVKNAANIISMYDDNIAIVVSAMGKTTNAMEKITKYISEQDHENFKIALAERKKFHQDIAKDLFDEKHKIFKIIASYCYDLEEKYSTLKSANYDFLYDQVVSIGEFLSTYILSEYLIEKGVQAKWIDASTIIKTDRNFREGRVDWLKTNESFGQSFLNHFKTNKILITQGFIGGTENEEICTLGREGSDYSAAIVAYCCDATDITIWKDVPGMLNADPRKFEDTVTLEMISYKEAIELSYYGASVIHPKTVKPLQNKNIPLYVKSFIDPRIKGTSIQSAMDYDHLIPSFIIKPNQVLFSFVPQDFSFIEEDQLSEIFKGLSNLGAKINLMQNSALSFSVLLDREKVDPFKVLEAFKGKYTIRYNDQLELITIRHYDNQTIQKITKDKTIILEQRTRDTIRFVVN